MTINHFNAFYKPYLRALKIKNIYLNQFKYNRSWFNILYCLIFLTMIVCVFWMANTKYYFLSLTVYFLSALSFYFSDKKALKNCIKQLRKKHSVKFLTLSQLEQVKYYLWKEQLQDKHLTFSIKKALSYLEMELSKFNNKRNMPSGYLLILSGISLIAFWRIFDDIHLIGKSKIILDAAIFYISYRYVVLKFYFFSNKEKELLDFKQNLLRLKSEFS
jgi:hypothetical protein